MNAEILERLAGVTVLIVGDVMLDEYLWGEVERISPEAPVPIVRVARRTCAPGGAANAAVAVSALGGRARLAGITGDDENAARLRTALAENAVEIEGLVSDSHRITTTKSRLLARGQHVVRTDSEDRGEPSAHVTRRLIAYAAEQVAAADVILISDYGKGVISGSLARTIIDLAARAGHPVVADPTGNAYAKYLGVQILTPSIDELAAAVGRLIRSEQELQRATNELSALLPGTDVLVTRGPDGMRLVRAGATALDIPTQARTVFDVTGAGDTVAAMIAVALGAGLDTETAVHLANTAAGLVVGKVGTASVQIAELAELI